MNFICPHCGIQQIVTTSACAAFENVIRPGRFRDDNGLEWPVLRVRGSAIRCANPECGKLTLRYSAGGHQVDHEADGDPLVNCQLYPAPVGKPFPEDVPAFLLEDYREAWAISHLSPKASATLARRCLQSMIRDFCGIRERTLFAEINKLDGLLGADALPRGVEVETVAAMRALKDVGNIGAHMTEVEGTIVDVEPGEAEALLGLIEMLFADWYVARAKRQKRLAEIEAIAADKAPPTASD
jgi:hypothetical protein